MHVSHPLQHLAQCLRIQISVHVMHAMLNCYRERYKFGHLLKKHKQTNKQTNKQANKQTNTHTHRAVILYLCVVLTLAAKNGSLPPFCHIIYNFCLPATDHRPTGPRQPTGPPTPDPAQHTTPEPGTRPKTRLLFVYWEALYHNTLIVGRKLTWQAKLRIFFF